MEQPRMDESEHAVSCFQEGFNCSQAVLTAFAPGLGMDREAALKVAGAFGGGMAGMGETCGAVTGAFMVIGLKHPRLQAGDEETKQKVYHLVEQFVQEFKQRNGTLLCRELLPEDQDSSDSLCTGYVRDAAEILERLLD